MCEHAIESIDLFNTRHPIWGLSEIKREIWENSFIESWKYNTQLIYIIYIYIYVYKFDGEL